VTTAVLVHGGFHDPSCWDLVRAELAAAGIRSEAPRLPMSSTVDTDAAVVRATLDRLDDDAVVVAHSWGGSVVTLGASGAPNVRHLVYLTAFMIEAGRPAPGDPRVQPPTAAVHIGPEWAVVDPARAYETLYQDCDPALAAESIGRLRPFATVGWTPVPTPLVAAWRLVPTTYVVCTEDRCNDPAAQRAMAADADEVVEIRTGHSPFLSRPRLLADLIAARVRRTQRREVMP
jgi:pimeloyl-ACP methyl ester carboxylesterase